MKKVVRSKMIVDHRKTHKPAPGKKPAKPKAVKPVPKKVKPAKPKLKLNLTGTTKRAKDLPPQKGDSKPVDPKNPKGPKWGMLFGRKPKNTKKEGEKRPDPTRAPTVTKGTKSGSGGTRSTPAASRAGRGTTDSATTTKGKGGKQRPDFTSRRAKGAGARRAGSSSASKPGRKKSKPTKASTRPAKKKDKVKPTKPRPPRVRKPIKTYAAWVVFDNLGQRVEVFPYHDRSAAEQCLAKKRGRRLADGSYEHGTFYVNLVKES